MKTPLRVLQISVRSDMGGGPRHLFDLLRCLKGTEIACFVAAPDEKPFGSKFRALAHGFFPIPHRRPSAVAIARLAALISREKIDLIHSHGRGAGYYSRMLGPMTQTPVIHTFHGIFSDDTFSSRLKMIADRFLARTNFTAIFVAPSEARQATETGVVRNQTQIMIPNAVDLTRFSGAHQHSTPGSRRIGAFLNTTQAKGADLFLKLAQACEGLPWTFECAGLSLNELEKIGTFSSNVKALGVCEEPAEWLMGLDLYVSCARQEGFPIGVLESMAAGTPCYLSDIEAHRIFIDQEAARVLCADAFMTELETFENSRHALTKMAVCARSVVEEHYSLAKFKTEMTKLYLASIREDDSPELFG
jgi:glycosyltransferase involved in cell wall biosynthesis